MRPFSDVDLHAFVDGQISAERRALISAYLSATPAEAARVDLWRRQNETIRGLFAGAASEPVPLWLTIGQVAAGRNRSGLSGADALQDNRRVTASRPLPARPVLRRRPMRTIGLWTAGAIALAAFALGLALPSVMPAVPALATRWLPMPAASRDGVLQRLAVRTEEAHRTFGRDAEQPAEIVDMPRGALAAWFRRHVGVPVRVPDLSALGWTLRGGRVVPSDGGSAALLIYEGKTGDRLSLVVAPVTNPTPAETAYSLEAGPTLVWLDGPVGFGLASSRSRAWLTDNADTLYRAIYGRAEE